MASFSVFPVLLLLNADSSGGGAEAFLLDDTEGATSDPLFLQIYSLMSLSRMLLGFPKSSSSVTGSDPVKCSKVRSCPFIFTLLSGLDTECVCMYCMSLFKSSSVNGRPLNRRKCGL